MTHFKPNNAAVESVQVIYDAAASESDATSTTVRLLSSVTLDKL